MPPQPTTSVAQSQAIVDEYAALSKQWEDHKRLRRTTGVEWPCFDCGLTYPPEGFGANPIVAAEVDALCFAPGHWRRCQTCQRVEHSGLRSKQCTGPCGLLRAPSFFPLGSSVCCACVARQTYEVFVCGRCNAGKRNDQVMETSAGGGCYICFQCAPELRVVECTVCNQQQPSIEFREKGKLLLQKCIRRCRDCRRCPTCNQVFENATSFEVNSRLCRDCYKK